MGEDLVTTTRPFLYYSQIFGLSPVRVTTGSRVKPWLPGMVYSLVLAGVLWFPLQSGYDNVRLMAPLQQDVSFIWKFFGLVFGPITTAMILLSSVWSCRNLCDVINQLSRCDISTVTHKHTKYIFLGLLIACHVMCFYHLYNENEAVFYPAILPAPPSYTTSGYFLSSIAWGVFDVVSWPQILNVWYLLYFVYCKFSAINDRLTKTLSRYEQSYLTKDRCPKTTRIPQDSRKRIARIRHLHMQLVRISLNLKDVFAVRVLIILGHTLVQLCFSTYAFIVVFVVRIGGHTLHITMSWVALRFTAMFLAVMPFWMVVSEANRSSLIVHDALSKPVDSDMKEELVTFSMVLENQKFGFAVHKMVRLNKNAIVDIISLVITYTMLILMLNLSFLQILQELSAKALQILEAAERQ